MTPGYSELVITKDADTLHIKECGAEICIPATANMARFFFDWAVDRLGVEEASRILAKRSNHAEG